MTLQEHFGEAGGGAEVAIDLERRVSVKEIRIRAAASGADALGAGADGGELGPEDFFAAVAVAEAGPEVKFVGEAPAGAGVAAGVEGLAGGDGEFGRVAHGDFVAGVEAPEVGDVAVGGLGFWIGFEPFHDTAIGADASGSEAGALGGEFGGERFLGGESEDFRGFDGGVKEVAEELLVDGGAEAHVGALAVGE